MAGTASKAAAWSNSSDHVVTSAAQWKKQLITKEDPNHIHKTLGILVLLSYMYRLSQVGETDMGFATKPHLTIPTLLLHLALNASSFEFKIPQRRIKGGFRIWPEYRLHSLVFLVRSLAMMTVFWIETEFHLQRNTMLNLVIVLATMAAADLSSASQGPHQSGFARELDVPAAVQYFFSAAQFYATSMILVGTANRRYTMLFFMVMIVQGNAFLMTIRRKNLASHVLLTTIYGVALGTGAVLAVLEVQQQGSTSSGSSSSGIHAFRCMALVAHTAVVLRTGPRLLPMVTMVQNNKYVLWICVYGLLEYYWRPMLKENDDDGNLPWRGRVCVLSSTAAMLGLGYYKYVKEQRAKTTTAGGRKTV